MARGDALYARGDVDWPTDPRCRKLSIVGRWINECLWRLSVKERRETLPLDKWWTDSVHDYANVRTTKRRDLDKAWLHMAQLGLIYIEHDNAITIVGVKACHPRLKWKPSPYGDCTGTIQDIIERREGEGEGESPPPLDPANTTNSDLPKNNLKPLPIDPDFPRYSTQEDLTDDCLILAKICEKLEKYSTFEKYPKNWKAFAKLVNDGFDISILDKAVDNHIKQFGTVKFKPGFKNDHPNEASIKDRAEKTVTAPQTGQSDIFTPEFKQQLLDNARKSKERENAERNK